MRVANLKSQISNRLRRADGSAFTLLEVMIAAGIFFAATFAILGLVSQTLRNARALQQNEPDMGILAGQMALTNSLAEEQKSGDFHGMYPGYHWSSDVYGVASNGLFEADFTISRRVGRVNVEDHMSVLLYRPGGPQTAPRGTLP
jgi:Tfp pilus assembly protein PilV